MILRHYAILFSPLLMLCSGLASQAQETFPVNGPRHHVHVNYVFTHAQIVTRSGELLTNATLIVRDDRIADVGRSVEIPANSVVTDLSGKWIYPSFIDMDSQYGLKSTVKEGQVADRRSRSPQMESNKSGAYAWNQAIHPETNASDEFHSNAAMAASLRKMGFGMVLSHQHDGIMRGSSAAVFTGDEKDNLMVFKPAVANHLSFSKGSSKQDYPSSQMGAIALIRQTFYDAMWYRDHLEKKEFNLSLKALIDNASLPVVFECEDYLSSLRAIKLAREFKVPVIVTGNGDEYRRINEFSSTNTSFIVPLKWPLPYDLSGSYDALELSLEKMQEWELAPYDARFLQEAKIPFALSGKGMKELDFWKNLRALEKTGLKSEAVLDALTTTPAKLMGMDGEIGKLAEGYLANFLVCSGNIFDKESILIENWVRGKKYIINETTIDIRGNYDLNVKKDEGLNLSIEGSRDNPKAKITQGKKEIPVEFRQSGHQIELKYKENGEDSKYILLSGQINDKDSRIWAGKAQLADGSWIDWAAIRQREFKTADTSAKKSDSVRLPVIRYPMGAFGWDSLPKEEITLFKHATIWTNEDTGIVRDADICISNGKILAIGQGLNKAGLFGTKDVKLKVIEAKGKHITSGIIDEHSHIAISRGVNESGQAVSAEVRIGDVIDPDDVNIYRQVAGGVIASQLLHGSANPIGGQSALVKLRWGMTAEDMKIKAAQPFIKFALGENVKQSNWGDNFRVRYPQTRMGVEQVYYDAFNRAREYNEIQQIYQSGLKSKKGKKNPLVPPRRDLELEALAEILNGQRFITCHSYVQSEINMLMHVADSMHFRVNTFTHILEGYKVADKMKKHGAGASTFSDWWAYKFEVNDAIPYNAAILNSRGVVTAINSDDAEMGRRLNQEAAKSVRYGGMSEEDAWKMVTLNPAKLLHLDHRMGSLKVGKDADIVLWSDNPLSINAVVEYTYIDGKCYYNKELDQAKRNYVASERARLIQKIIEAGSKSEKKGKVGKSDKRIYNCESTDDEGYETDEL